MDVRKRFFTLVLALLSISISPAMAGPFGIDINDKNIDKYDCTNVKQLAYTCENIPNKHDDFESYIIHYSKKIGICAVYAIGKDITDGSFGTGIRVKVDEIYAQVASKYGPAKKMDYLAQGSIWNRPQDWMMGYIKKERYYGYIGELGKSIEGISTYGVFANVFNQSTGFVKVEFFTENYDACEKEIEKEKSSKF